MDIHALYILAMEWREDHRPLVHPMEHAQLPTLVYVGMVTLVLIVLLHRAMVVTLSTKRHLALPKHMA